MEDSIIYYYISQECQFDGEVYKKNGELYARDPVQYYSNYYDLKK